MSQAICLVDIWPTLCLAITAVPPVIMLTSVFMLCALGKHLLTKCILTKRCLDFAGHVQKHFAIRHLTYWIFGQHGSATSHLVKQVSLCCICRANVYRSIAFWPKVVKPRFYSPGPKPFWNQTFGLQDVWPAWVCHWSFSQWVSLWCFCVG